MLVQARVWLARMLLAWAALVTVSCGAPPSASTSQSDGAARPTDLFSYTSDYADYLGLGQSKSFTPPTARFVVEPGTTPDWLQLVVQTKDVEWSIDIAAPTGQTLKVGTYDNTVELPYRSDASPVLFVYGNGRGCSHYSGSFTVQQIVFDRHATLQALQTTFVQRCAETSNGAFRGTLHYGRAS